MKIVLALTLCISGLGLAQIIEFPDPNLKDALVSGSYFPATGPARNIDENGDGEISVAEARSATGTIIFNDKGIGMLDGMEYFSGIDEINIFLNPVKSLRPLSNLSNLRKLVVLGCEINELVLSQSLENIQVEHNPLTGHVFIEDMPNLVVALLSWNQIERVTLRNLPKFKTLYAPYNSIDMLHFEDVPVISGLILDVNNISMIDHAPSSVSTLLLSGNPITTIPKLPSLVVLELNACYLESLSGLEDIPNLSSLRVSCNRLTSVREIAEHPVLGTKWGLNCDRFDCDYYYHLTMVSNPLSFDDCGDLKAIVDKFPLAMFPLIPEIPDCALFDFGWLPHITRETGGFDTVIQLVNPYSESDAFELTGYDEAGIVLSHELIELDGSMSISLNPSELFTQRPSHIRLSESSIVSTVVFQSVNAGAEAHVPATSQYGHEHWFKTANPDLVFDGVALVNPGDEQITVTLEKLDATHQISESISLGTIMPKAKTLFVVNDVLLTSVNSQDVIRLTTSGPTIALFLRGTPPDQQPGYLYVNPAIRTQ